MFVRPIIEQTKGHFEILELLVITFGTGRLRHQARTQTFGTSVVVPYCYLFLLSVFILWFSYYVSDIFVNFR